MKKEYIFIVQVTRQLSVDIINNFVINGSSVELITGNVEYNYAALDKVVKVKLFNKYNQSSFSGRLRSGLLFSLRCFCYLIFKSGKKELILVSTPPFILYVGWLLKKLRRQKYHLIIWDLYPDVIVNMNVVEEKRFIMRLWGNLNRHCFKHASTIFTLGKHLSNAIKKYTDVDPVIVPNWVDTSFIKPMDRAENIFAKKYNLTNEVVVMYSGNFGLTHDIESVVYAAKELLSNKKIKFVLIGEGSKIQWIENFVKENSLSNVLVLPYQDRSMLPYSLTSADISIVTLSKGAESVSVPSKTYYSLASGSAIIALAAKESELGVLIKNYNCGYVMENSSPNEIAQVILDLSGNSEKLNALKSNSRNASMDFSPENAKEYYLNIIKD